MIRDIVEMMTEREGKAPAGWMSRRKPGRRDEDHLAGNGFRYTLDWPMDDQPVWMRTGAGRFERPLPARGERRADDRLPSRDRGRVRRDDDRQP